MTVKILATGKTEDVNDSYGARLVEQGKAVPTPPVAEEVDAARRETVPETKKTDCHVADAPRNDRGTNSERVASLSPTSAKRSETAKEKPAKKR